MSTRLLFDNLNNTRDLGGMRTMDGRMIVSGKLIRSGHLCGASVNDIQKLQELAELVIDFRMTLRTMQKPDPAIHGITYIHHPILAEAAMGITYGHEQDMKRFAMMTEPESIREYMCDTYTRFAKNEFSIRQYAAFLRMLLVKREKAVLWHCTAGKDRAGFAAVLVETILGVSRKDIIKDYLKTNEYIADHMDEIKQEYLRDTEDPEAVSRSVEYMYSAKEEYLQSLFDKIHELYGDLDGYIYDAMRITEEECEQLRELYLVPGDNQ
ncbi:MAG: tyrosine-protein phosphatase [Solobacterium sp.]|nr:tyrosine-protein phosphatase [Solobacterium sp.]